jgi:hypothetical protein
VPHPLLQRPTRSGTPAGVGKRPETAIARLAQLLAEASRLAAVVSSEVTAAGPGRIAATLAEAEAARRRAEADVAAAVARTANAKAAAEAAWEAADMADESRDAALARAAAAEAEVRDLRSRIAAELARASEAGEKALAVSREQAAREIASAQAACQAHADAARPLADAAIARAERAETALDTERSERRTLTNRLRLPSPAAPAEREPRHQHEATVIQARITAPGTRGARPWGREDKRVRPGAARRRPYR